VVDVRFGESRPNDLPRLKASTRARIARGIETIGWSRTPVLLHESPPCEQVARGPRTAK
jgi:hypothetical protein